MASELSHASIAFRSSLKDFFRVCDFSPFFLLYNILDTGLDSTIFCVPFHEFSQNIGDAKENFLMCLVDLFSQVNSVRLPGYVAHKKWFCGTELVEFSIVGDVDNILKQNLIYVNKSTKRFRKKGCMFYEKLCTIFGDTIATGSNVDPSTRSPNDDDDDDATSISLYTRNEENGFDEDGGKRRGKSTAISNSQSVKIAKLSLALADALATYNETAKRKTELIERSGATSTSHYLLDESVEALNQIDGNSAEVYAKTIEKFENEVSITMFLKMSEHTRIDWLLNLK
ncbi:uncharacterized protein LOC133785849 [Humulus lupulus]|uniref:uncharacterized protein LOC133785849 n=1 Tax=Humulus lupulus TaxID=3486 RepID=UPI002B400858|nr:uncharacterized protein LOC133785849 [Humulus lupulus]